MDGAPGRAPSPACGRRRRMRVPPTAPQRKTKRPPVVRTARACVWWRQESRSVGDRQGRIFRLKMCPCKLRGKGLISDKISRGGHGRDYTQTDRRVSTQALRDLTGRLKMVGSTLLRVPIRLVPSHLALRFKLKPSDTKLMSMDFAPS